MDENMRLWQAIKEARDLIQSVKADVAKLAEDMHAQSGQSITDTQMAVAELTGLVLGEPLDGEETTEEETEQSGDEGSN